HRQAEPKRKHEGFGRLPRRMRQTVRSLAAMLRLAESLDRSHAQVVAGLELHDRGDDDLLQLRAAGDAELELWAAARSLAPLERITGKPLRLEGGRSHVDGTAAQARPALTDDAYAEQPDTTARLSRQAVRSRRHRRLGQDDAARSAGEVADGRRAPRVRHRMELVRPRQGG